MGENNEPFHIAELRLYKAPNGRYRFNLMTSHRGSKDIANSMGKSSVQEYLAPLIKEAAAEFEEMWR